MSIQEDLKDFDEAYVNTYRVIIGEKVDEGWVLYDPTCESPYDFIPELIDYFENLEDYEKCQKLKTIADDLKRNSV